MPKQTKEQRELVRRNISRVAEIAEEINNTPGQVRELYRGMLADLREGLPRATSPEVLNSACKW